MTKLISWSWIMMKLISKKTWGKIKKRVFRRRSWLIHHLQNMSHLKIYTLWWSTINLFSNRWTSWSYLRNSITRNTLAEWLSTRQKTRRPTTNFSKKDFKKRKMDLILPIIFAITPIDALCYRVIDSLILK